MIYFDLFFTFLKIGLFTIGGGYAMLPMIREEVSSHGWLSQSELIDFIAQEGNTLTKVVIWQRCHNGTLTRT